MDKDFYITVEYILKLAQHSSELFKCSEYEERQLLINTLLLKAIWQGVSLCYDYKEPFNLLAEMNKRTEWGPLLDTSRTNIIKIKDEASILNKIIYLLNHNRNCQFKTL